MATPSRFDPLPEEDDENPHPVAEDECPFDVANEKIKKYGPISKQKKKFLAEQKRKYERDMMQEMEPLLEVWKKAYFMKHTFEHLTYDNIGTDVTLGGTLDQTQQITFQAEMAQYAAEKVQEMENLKQNDRVKAFHDQFQANIAYEEMNVDKMKSDLDPDYKPRSVLEQHLEHRNQELARLENRNQELANHLDRARRSCLEQTRKNTKLMRELRQAREENLHIQLKLNKLRGDYVEKCRKLAVLSKKENDGKPVVTPSKPVARMATASTATASTATASMATISSKRSMAENSNGHDTNRKKYKKAPKQWNGGPWDRVEGAYATSSKNYRSFRK